MRAYIRIVGQNFSVGDPYVLYDGYTWDGVSGHPGTAINAPPVQVDPDDSDRDIAAKIVAAASYFLTLPKRSIVLY